VNTEIDLSHPKFFDTLNRHLEQLDDAELSSESILSERLNKENYETRLMFVVRKYQAAVYHYSNVLKYIDKEIAKLNELAAEHKAPVVEGIRITQFSMKGSTPADHYIYELSACLEAIKSALDFLSTVCSSYLTGASFDSISTLIKLVKKGSTGPIIDETQKHFDWLKHISNYRHHLVHRLIFTAPSSYEVHHKEEQSQTIRHPVIISATTPKYVADTRLSRMIADYFEGGPTGISTWSETVLTLGDGRKETTVSFTGVTPFEGFVAIEEFMLSSLQHFIEYANDILEALIELDFHSVRL
jgi:hypothetical protein